jgi:hypothetical protein
VSPASCVVAMGVLVALAGIALFVAMGLVVGP